MVVPFVLVAVSHDALSSTLHPTLEATAKVVEPEAELTLLLLGLTSKVAVPA